MRIARIHTDQPLAGGLDLSLPTDSAKYLSQVLRLRANDSIVLFNGDGFDYPATLLSCSKTDMTACVGDPGPVEPEPQFRIHLALGISRGERMDFALQKAVELGVASINPLITERTVVRLDVDRRINRQRHWHRIMISACEQSGRRRLPIMASAQPFDEWLRRPPAHGVLLDQRAPVTLPEISPPATEITFLIGPEGGLTAAEHTVALQAGLSPAKLGPRVLRTETAPLAAIATAQALWGDFR